MPRITPLTRLARGRYQTKDGAYVVESDVPSLGDRWDRVGGVFESEVPEPQEWFVYTAEQVTSGQAGPPVALFEAPTLRECREWLSRCVAEEC